MSIANAFNKFFAGIGDNFVSSIPPADISPVSTMPPRQLHSLFFPAKFQEIEIEIKFKFFQVSRTIQHTCWYFENNKRINF